MQNRRADIEGLRALAVVLVVFYHFQFPGVSGGFIGVDVFLVISGYVITRLLRRQMDDGNFRFGDFYARRVRRLLPALLVVSTASFFAISPFYLDDDYYFFAQSWLAMLGGVSNFYFYAELNQYFAPEAKVTPLLHTWSLAVEEQFYLLWPAVLLAYRKLRCRSGIALLILVWCAALALSVHLAQTNAKAAFYLLPARLFELMLGAGLALCANRLPLLGRALAECCGLIGLALILASATLLDGDALFPGLNALWPTLGTALIILAGSGRQPPAVTRLLGTPPLVALGALSYSLYLWHWPPVAILHYQLIELTWPLRIALVAGSLLLAWLTHRYIENRYRYRDWSLRRSLLLLVLLPAIPIWLAQVTIRLADDLSFRIPPHQRELYRIVEQNNAGDLFDRCFEADSTHFDRSAACRFGNDDADSEVDSVLIGDSHATALVGFVEQLLPQQGHSLLLITQASTPFVTPERARQLWAEDDEKRLRTLALAGYLDAPPRTVFVAARWDAYLRDARYQDYFLEALQWLRQRRHRVIVVGGAPELPSTAYAHCLLKSRHDCRLPVAAITEQRMRFERFGQAVMQRLPETHWIDLTSAICTADHCDTVLNGIPLYRDDHHLNHRGATDLGKAWRRRFGTPLIPADNPPQETVARPRAADAGGVLSPLTP